MVPVIRIGMFILNILCIIVNFVQYWLVPRKQPTYPPIRNKLLLKPIVELQVELREKKITSEQLVRAYIERIKEVNPSLNAVIDERYDDAIKDAQLADKMIAKANAEQLLMLFVRYPLLGIPCTIKNSCRAKGMDYCVGSIDRIGLKAEQDGDVTELLRSAGCIPLAVTATPEFCMAIETNPHTTGRCHNPYDLHRVTAGSSGGEGAVNGAGASLFGLGSDVACSIRLPSSFCGIFGHKPTGGLVSVKGHFPYSDDPNFATTLQLGPMTRFARDLPILMQIMAGENRAKLKFDEMIPLKDIKIYYMFGFDGLNAIFHPPVAFDIKLAMKRALKCFENGGLSTKPVSIKGFKNSMEIALGSLVELTGIPSMMTHSCTKYETTSNVLKELLKSLCGQSKHTKEALVMEWMFQEKIYTTQQQREQIKKDKDALKAELVQLLGTDGVLFLPSHHRTAFGFHTSLLNITGLDYLTLFNVLGLPATHVTMGLDHKGMPIGFQVIAAPYQDKLCLQIAAELEGAFGGWVPPLKSSEIVDAYIERIRAVNPHINAIVAERFTEAQKEAQHADDMIGKTPNNRLHALFARYPLLGVPFTVKESCGVKKMAFIIGSKQRIDEKCPADGEVVSLLRESGGIPLLVSANPEYCFSIETNTHTQGKCLNPYDPRRTCGGSSGGEGALNGAGASLFGVGSDIAGSIRIPSLFNGIFGHKPTAGVTSIKGLFPASHDELGKQYLQVGPMTRFGRDLGLLMHLMIRNNAERLDLLTPVETESIQVFYAFGFDRLNGLLHSGVDFDFQLAIMKAVKYFEKKGLTTQRARIKGFAESTEIALSGIVRLRDFPFLMQDKTATETAKEYLKSWLGRSQYTKDGLIFELMRRANAFMKAHKVEEFKEETAKLKEEIVQLLGPNGVLFFPTFHVPAIHHNTSHLALWGIDYTLIFNVLGLPATHIPMGLGGNEFPVGFQVIAAPYKDKLCFQIAGELELAFGGWTPPTPHEI